MKNPLDLISNILKPKKIIFIVEDNAVYANTLKTSIQRNFQEIEVKIFPVGEMCLAELDKDAAIIIMDYFLNSEYPEAHNGLEIIKKIKNQKPNTQIVVLSSQDQPGVILKAIKDHDCRYVQKDEESFKHIEKIIKDCLSEKGAAAMGH